MNIFFSITFDDEKTRIAFCPEEIRKHRRVVHQRSFCFHRRWTWSIEKLVLQFELGQVGLQNLLLIIFWNATDGFDDWAGSLLFEAWALALKLELLGGLLLDVHLFVHTLVAVSQFALKLKMIQKNYQNEIDNLQLKVDHLE